MMTVKEAQNIIQNQRLDLGIETIPIALSSGRVLAQPIHADRDSPPFDRVTMDGIAIQSTHFSSGKRFQLEGTQAAGQRQQTLANPANCMEVMTGAILPKGTDCVIPYEQVDLLDRTAVPRLGEVMPFQNVHRQGSDAKNGDVLLPDGSRLDAGRIGLMASFGISTVRVTRLPRVIVCATGDELVSIDQVPESHQIRNSNSSMLLGALHTLGIHADTEHLPDNRYLLLARLSELKDQFDVLLFSGSVSKGKFDYLPEVLEELGLNKKIHGVAQRPGKPFLFGSFERALVFGFPGNPASTLVCFYSFFVTWLKANQGIEVVSLEAELDSSIYFPKPLTYHHLVTVSPEKNKWIASPVKNSGSGDLIHLAMADGFISLPPDQAQFEKGESFPLTLWRQF